MTPDQLQRAANTIKGLAMDAVEKANSRDSWYADEAG